MTLPPSRARQVQEHDRELFDQLMRFARKEGGPEWLDEAMDVYLMDEQDFDELELQLALPWVAFHYPNDDGRSMGQRFAERHSGRLTAGLRDLLQWQLAAWLSVWEVQSVDVGVGLELTDLLTGQSRFVHEVRGSTSGLHRGAALLGRVVDAGDTPFLAGIHFKPLGPLDADFVVKAIRRHCRVRTKPISTTRLQDPAVQLVLLDAWRRACEARKAPPTLVNSEGHMLVLTSDHFQFAAPDRKAVIRGLANLEGAEEPHVSGAEAVIPISVRTRGDIAGQLTLIARAIVSTTRLTIETNSTERADRMREHVEARLGRLVKHRLREEQSQESLSRQSALEAPEPTPPEIAAAIRDMRQQHMMAWIDEAIPALNGLTPRKAMEKAGSRRDLTVLLKDFEIREATLPEDQRVNIAAVRDALGLPGK